MLTSWHFGADRDILVKTYFFDQKMRKTGITLGQNEIYSLVSHGTIALNVSNMEKIKYRNSPSVVVGNYFP